MSLVRTISNSGITSKQFIGNIPLLPFLPRWIDYRSYNEVRNIKIEGEKEVYLSLRDTKEGGNINKVLKSKNGAYGKLNKKLEARVILSLNEEPNNYYITRSQHIIKGPFREGKDGKDIFNKAVTICWGIGSQPLFIQALGILFPDYTRTFVYNKFNKAYQSLTGEPLPPHKYKEAMAELRGEIKRIRNQRIDYHRYEDHRFYRPGGVIVR